MQNPWRIWRGNLKNRNEMEASYAAFLKEFIENPKQMVFVETVEKQWVCGLRAVESEPGKLVFDGS